MKQTLHLYNHFHNGDVFLARIIIQYFIKDFNVKFYHNLNHGLLSDIEEIEEIKGIPSNFSSNSSNFVDFQINTWIGQKGMSYMNKVHDGFCVENYMVLIKEILEYFNIEIKSEEENLPIINYNKIKNFDILTEKINIYKHNFDKLVLISNGVTLSGQAPNFNFTPIIEKLSKSYPQILFLVTEKTALNLPNIVYTSDITEIFPDLLQISYLSTYCDVIVGRSSGPYTYCATRDNLLNPNKTFIGFTYKVSEAKYYQSALANMIWSSNFVESEIFNLISNNL